MKTQDFQNALSNVDDKYIAEAASYKKTAARSMKIWRAIAIAACCLIAVPVTIFAAMMVSDATGWGAKASSQAAYDGSYYEETTVPETRAAADYYSNNEVAAGGSYYDNGYAAEEAAEYEIEMPMEDADMSENTVTGSSNTSSSVPQNDAKIIRTADIDMQSTSYDESVDLINALVEEFGGYFESRSISDGSGYRNASLSIRIPAEHYDSFIERLKDAGAITSLYENVDDVSDSYRDIESRLETAKTKLARLQELLAKAEDMSDIITIESAISDTELEIDYLQGNLNGYDSRVSYSSVFIYLKEVYKVENNDAPITFGERMSRAFHNSLDSFGDAMGDLAVWLAESWIWLLIVAVIIASAIIVPISCVKAARKRRNR